MPETTRNLLKLARNDRSLHPNVAIYYVTGQCNLNCVYCEDFGARRNSQNQQPLPVEQVMHILRVARSGVNALMLTGGEPFTHPQIDQIARRAKEELKFKELTVISNGFLLPQHEAALKYIDRLIISLDCLDAGQWSQTIGVPASTAQTILDNIRKYAGLQNQFGYQMVVNTVITPETLHGAEDLLNFCREHKILISFSPQAVNNWPRYELAVSEQYRALIDRLILLKRQGAPILGSESYLQTLRDFQPYDCYPTLAPRIYTNGDLSYPCRPLEKAENGQGGRPVNLLNVQTWAEAQQIAFNTYGQPPRSCHSCFQQCYAESSLMQAHPLTMVQEWLRYPPSRDFNLTTYSPG